MKLHGYKSHTIHGQLEWVANTPFRVGSLVFLLLSDFISPPEKQTHTMVLLFQFSDTAVGGSLLGCKQRVHVCILQEDKNGSVEAFCRRLHLLKENNGKQLMNSFLTFLHIFPPVIAICSIGCTFKKRKGF
jgi:hypothetical protein